MPGRYVYLDDMEARRIRKRIAYLKARYSVRSILEAIGTTDQNLLKRILAGKKITTTTGRRVDAIRVADLTLHWEEIRSPVEVHPEVATVAAMRLRRVLRTLPKEYVSKRLGVRMRILLAIIGGSYGISWRMAQKLEELESVSTHLLLGRHTTPARKPTASNLGAIRSRKRLVRARTEVVGSLSTRADDHLYPAELLVGVRPKTRADCANVPRPCPFVGCRYNLFLDVGKGGAIRRNFPDLDVLEMPANGSCSLDIADELKGRMLRVDTVGSKLNITRERIRQLMAKIERKLLNNQRLKELHECCTEV